MSVESITWTRQMLARFETRYAKAVRDNVSQFSFDGHEFVVAYAKYLIEYLKGRFA